MKFLCWNIAGAYTFTGSIGDALSYDKEDLGYFIGEIKNTEAEVIILQEAHIPNDEIMMAHAKEIADSIGYQYSITHPYGNSHIKKGHQLALATISKYPITRSYFHLLPNPKLKVVRPNGDEWVSLEVGFHIAEIEYLGKKINVANCHLVPLHYFGREYMEKEFEHIRNDVSNLALSLSKDPTIFAGDFNFNDLSLLLPQVFKDGIYKEAFVGMETTPGKGQQDHVLYSNHWKMSEYKVGKVKADHYQCIVDLSLE